MCKPGTARSLPPIVNNSHQTEAPATGSRQIKPSLSGIRQRNIAFCIAGRYWASATLWCNYSTK